MENNEKPGFLKYAFLTAFTVAAVSLALYYNKEVNAGIEKALQKADEVKPDCVRVIDEKIKKFYDERIKMLYPGKE